MANGLGVPADAHQLENIWETILPQPQLPQAPQAHIIALLRCRMGSRLSALWLQASCAVQGPFPFQTGSVMEPV